MAPLCVAMQAMCRPRHCSAQAKLTDKLGSQRALHALQQHTCPPAACMSSSSIHVLQQQPCTCPGALPEPVPALVPSLSLYLPWCPPYAWLHMLWPMVLVPGGVLRAGPTASQRALQPRGAGTPRRDSGLKQVPGLARGFNRSDARLSSGSPQALLRLS